MSEETFKIEFDRERLAPRETQIVEAMVLIALDARIALLSALDRLEGSSGMAGTMASALRVSAARDHAWGLGRPSFGERERPAAEIVVAVLNRALPDLNFQIVTE